ncbi:hypothetical protein [Synechococcus sp. CCY 9618]|uniref:hypothetical protein n=1 Tax=Synechococcus sp. CCY 9618 TaxID=2815602 RepID=UPI00352BE27F
MTPFVLWLVRPRSDGGRDYVTFQPSQGVVEMREGSHLPPQMPLLKRRCCLAIEEAEACRRRLQQEAGYQRSEPLF